MKLACAVFMAFAYAALPALAAPTRIDDPLTFVRGVYAHYANNKSTNYAPPNDIYTPRLQALIRDDRRRAKGEVGCLDFDFWVDGQDWSIKNVSVTAGPAAEDRQTIIAKFVNLDSPEEIQFDFRKIAGRWLLDDVHSRKASGWTLSAILKCTP